MRLPLDGIDFEEAFDYYFINRFGELSHFRSNKQLEVGTIMYFDFFIADTYLLRVTKITEIEDKTVISFESCKDIALCDQSTPERYKHVFKEELEPKR